ncbi:LAETG motif-containing sortase-dependent surface protein [Streptomyces sp. NPDC059477]|uniref:LAETG motif-containing sortase-dependent surface protein n=1 Tax=Streptomyces sp. NPDC059477 TaxID=3346847 RepID=UPI0036CF6995
MKLRRALAVAAATAVISPLALLTAAPVAFATDGDTSPSPTSSESISADPSLTASPTDSESQTSEPTDTVSTTPSDDDKSSEPETDTETSTSPPATTPSTTPATTPAETTTPPEETESPDPEPSACADQKVDVTITGLPGKIEAGSGWHEFSLDVLNSSDSTLTDLDFFAGASPDEDGTDLFRTQQVRLQAWDPDSETWGDLNEEGYAVGYVGYTDELKPDYEVNIPLRIDVKSSAPVGAGFSLGATIYGDRDAECFGFGEVAYRFQIVASGTDTDGTGPQEGGKAPITDKEPGTNTPQVTGNLAETGSSSTLPVIGLVGGAAVVLGAGAVFVVRKRKTGVEA